MIANRGTDPSAGTDIVADVCIAYNQYDKCPHANRALKVARDVQSIYPGYAHGCTGHSLGGSACSLQAERLSMRGGCQLFNPGSSGASRVKSLLSIAYRQELHCE